MIRFGVAGFGAGKLISATALAAVAVAVGCGSDSDSSKDLVPPTARVAQRVEAIRGLQFKKVPRVRVLSDQELEEEAEKAVPELEDLSPAEQREVRRLERQGAASEQLLKLTGILEPGVRLEELASMADQELGGLYDPVRSEIVLIESALKDDRKKAEVILAHELVHALEDQRFDAFKHELDLLSDEAVALQSLLEGTATLAEIRYATRYLGANRSVSEVLKRREADLEEVKLPAPLRRALAFPYLSGARFADQLFRSGDGWRLLNRAQTRLPVSSEEILHPDKWRSRERPAKVQLGASAVLGRRWSRLGGAEFGEFDTSLLLAVGGGRPQASRAAAGWAGARFEVWRRKPKEKGCPSPCRRDTALVLGWAWDTPKDAREFARIARSYVENGLKGRRTTVATWQLKGGVVTLGVSPRTGSLGFAPSEALAQQLAISALGKSRSR